MYQCTYNVLCMYKMVNIYNMKMCFVYFHVMKWAVKPEVLAVKEESICLQASHHPNYCIFYIN